MNSGWIEYSAEIIAQRLKAMLKFLPCLERAMMHTGSLKKKNGYLHIILKELIYILSTEGLYDDHFLMELKMTKLIDKE